MGTTLEHPPTSTPTQAPATGVTREAPAVSPMVERDRTRLFTDFRYAESARQVPDVEFGQVKRTAMGVSVASDDDQFERRLVAGDTFTSDKSKELLVSEYLLYRLGIADDADRDRGMGTGTDGSRAPAAVDQRLLLAANAGRVRGRAVHAHDRIGETAQVGSRTSS